MAARIPITTPPMQTLSPTPGNPLQPIESVDETASGRGNRKNPIQASRRKRSHASAARLSRVDHAGVKDRKFKGGSLELLGQRQPLGREKLALFQEKKVPLSGARSFSTTGSSWARSPLVVALARPVVLWGVKEASRGMSYTGNDSRPITDGLGMKDRRRC